MSNTLDHFDIPTNIKELPRAATTFKLEGEVTYLSLSESSQGKVGRLLGEVNCN
jgi:hypothetical protein